jgi:membrane-associated phospholipid phosphatase
MPSRSTATSSDAGLRRARRLTAAGAVAFAAASAALVATKGLILSRDWLFAWLLLGLLAVSLADPKRWVRGVVVDWFPLMAVLLCYDLSLPVREWIGVTPHVLPQLDADRWVFGELPPITLQHALYDPGVAHWYDYVTFFVYLSHFFVTLAVLAVLWRVSYPRFRQYRTLVVVLATAGFVTYVLFPAVPPWLAAYEGHIAPVPRTLASMWGAVGIEPAHALFENRGEFYNQQAAIPSLHAAYPMLLLLFFWGAGIWARIGLGAYVLAMAFALVYTGEHYLSDVVIGWLYAGGIVAAVSEVRALRQPRRAPPLPARATY